ncbi:MAG TPA: 2-oxoacid:acceptor oxidoreductase family protein, partial [Chitinispirillaceae bacterium]|nr:2-oxoacid:acceptor oxidoreductase family protein [Chitinispirillaceae bacterium]
MPQKMTIDLKIKISGEAGEGIVSTGEVLMKVAAIMGYHSVAYKSFPPNIRGGYSQSLVTISENPIISALSDFDILFSLSDSSFKIDSKNIKNGNLVIIESNILKNIENKRKIDFLQKMGAIVYSAPVSKIGKEIASSTKIRSTITLGIISFLLDIPLTLMLDTILKRFGHKGSKIHDLNSTAVKKGFSWAKKNFNQISSYKILQKTTLNRNQVIFDGNQAISAGAIIAGCTFFSSYPITPATSIGECMAEHLPQVNGFSYQAEDEIAALGAV